MGVCQGAAAWHRPTKMAFMTFPAAECCCAHTREHQRDPAPVSRSWLSAFQKDGGLLRVGGADPPPMALALQSSMGEVQGEKVGRRGWASHSKSPGSCSGSTVSGSSLMEWPPRCRLCSTGHGVPPFGACRREDARLHRAHLTTGFLNWKGCSAPQVPLPTPTQRSAFLPGRG